MGAYWVVHRVCFSNVYLYSTLTTNSASISNYNHDVNLFLFMAYWLPSFIPSSIIFEDWFFVLMIWVHQPIWAPNSTEGWEVGPQKSGTVFICSDVVILYLYFTDRHFLQHFPPCLGSENFNFPFTLSSLYDLFFLSDQLYSNCGFITSSEIDRNVVFHPGSG